MPQTSDSGKPSDEAWVALQGFVAQIDRFARSSDSSQVFFPELLARLTNTLSAKAAAIWISGDSELSLECSHPVAGNEHGLDVGQECYRDLALFVARKGAPQYLASQADLAEEGVRNESAFGVYLVPLFVNRSVLGVLALFQTPDASPAAQRGYERLLATIAEIVGDFLCRMKLDQLYHSLDQSNALLELLASVSSQKDLQSASDQLVDKNELFGFDRVSLHASRGHGYRLISMSGISQFDRRSNVIRSLTQLVKSYARESMSAAMHFSTDDIANTDNLGDSIKEAAATHCTQIGATEVSILPLANSESARPLALLVGECFAGEANIDSYDVAMRESAVRVACPVVCQAVQTSRIPFVTWLRALSNRTPLIWLGSTLRLMMPLAAVTCALVIATYWKTDYRLSVHGELRPKTRQEVFAPADAEVVELLVQDGQQVKQNDILIRLASSSLDLKFQQALGEYDTTRKRLAGVASSRLQISPNEPDAVLRLSQLSATEEELKEYLNSKQLEMRLLREQRNALTLESPINGKVVAWDVTRELVGRPVRRGQSLLSVSDHAGPWYVHLYVPQQHVDHIQSVSADDATIIEFYLNTAPDKTMQAAVVEVARQVEWNDDMKKYVVVVKALAPELPPSDVRPGSVVHGKVSCGQRAIGYVWFGDAIERLRGEWMLFWSRA